MTKIKIVSCILIALTVLVSGFTLHMIFRPGNNLTNFLFSYRFQGRELGEIDDGMYADLSLTAVNDQYSLFEDWNFDRYKVMLSYYYYLKNRCSLKGDLNNELSCYCVLKYQARLMLKRLGFTGLKIKKENYLEKMESKIGKIESKIGKIESKIGKSDYINEKMSYHTHFNDKIDIDIYRPVLKQVKKIPLLLVIPEVRLTRQAFEKDMIFYEELAKRCVVKGYALFLFQYAGINEALDSDIPAQNFEKLNRFYKNRLIESSKSSGLSLIISDVFLLIHYLEKSPDSYVDSKSIFMSGFGRGGAIAQIAAAMNESIVKLISINGCTDFKSDPIFWDSPFMLNRMTEYNKRMGFPEFEHYKCLFSMFPRSCILNEISGNSFIFKQQSQIFKQKREQSYNWLYSSLANPDKLKINNLEIDNGMDFEKMSEKLYKMILKEL